MRKFLSRPDEDDIIPGSRKTISAYPKIKMPDYTIYQEKKKKKRGTAGVGGMTSPYIIEEQ